MFYSAVILENNMQMKLRKDMIDGNESVTHLRLLSHIT